MRNSPAPDPPAAPTACPFCRSPKVTAAGEKFDASTYWRCEACGEMWNLARLQSDTHRYKYDSRWK
jgi:transposase-like protein